ncbi:MAG: monofunctional biosynthetic peptidoglycan transglycosylase [Proteobacteria bacterium]|nr:monofunctional biosynthetic peptidoglycan transglycosylase [Pseudomonadota bacterium]
MKRQRRWASQLIRLVLLLFLGYELWFVGRVLILKWVEPTSTSFMRAYNKENNEASNYRWVNYDRISSHVKSAVVAAEDEKFVDHYGFDWVSIRKAAAKNAKKGKIVAGGSTITQQLAKNLFLSPSRSIWRKAQESIVTVMLEAILSKQRILEIYLNVIEWGRGVYGIEAAARHYFNRGAEGVSKVQAAKLASYIPAPKRYDIIGDTERSLRKAGIIRGRMSKVKIPNER